MANQLFVKMGLNAWYERLADADKILGKLSDEQLLHEVAPGRNRGIYLLGHLTAVHDRLLPMFSMGDRLYPQLDEVYLSNPDRAKSAIASAMELRQYWKNVNSTLAGHFNNLSTESWFQRHNAVSSEDFIKEPHRNKLNVLINRSHHLAYHTGQLALL